MAKKEDKAAEKKTTSKKQTSKKIKAEDKAKLQMEEAKAALEQEKDKYLRLFAEFENFKKRTAKERIELFKTANQEVISAMIPVLDDFNRAQQQLDKGEAAIDVEGFKLIFNKFQEVLKSNGLAQTEAKAGDSFDAEIHEAITQIPAPSEKEKGKIIDIIETGYQLGDRIIRYPKVVVGQ
ncbi:MAG: nucleotide exchange factor GrpE [Flavobacteriaceae bacterium]|jgi:molecular chaperone GrpE|nr:nucleotide exchange factor GrpE [Flavobacteriaceae bacterium]MDG1911690.1 nucleotide exchange factor GrpE [Flavobacteriaceae bacterium]